MPNIIISNQLIFMTTNSYIAIVQLGILFWHEGNVGVLDACNKNHVEIANVFGYLFWINNLNAIVATSTTCCTHNFDHTLTEY